jgi:predicted branched-subunit amino acid permease
MSSIVSTVLSLVLFVTYIGIGALAHDTHFSLAWALLSTALVWAGPAQTHTPPVIASEAKQSRTAYAALDCFVASLLAMTTSSDSSSTHPGYRGSNRLTNMIGALRDRSVFTT